MPELQDLLTELFPENYGQDVLDYGETQGGDYVTFQVDPDGKKYVIDQETRSKLDSILAAFNDEDFATDNNLTNLKNLLTNESSYTIGELIKQLNDEDFATNAKLEAVRTLLNSIDETDFAKDTNLQELGNNLGDKTDVAITDPNTDASNIALLKGLLNAINSLDNTDFSTESTLSNLKNAFDNENFSTEDSLSSLLDTVNNTDFASETTLGEVKSKLVTLLNSQDSENNLEVVEKEGVVSVDSSGAVVEDKVKEYRGLSSDTKPTGDIPRNSTFVEMDTRNIYYWNGLSWEAF